MSKIIVIGIAIWLFFLGGCEAIQRWTATANLSTVSTILKGADRVAGTAQVVFSTPVAVRPLVVPPAPVMQPQVVAQVNSATVDRPTEAPLVTPVRGPTATPIQPLETKGDPRFPNDGNTDAHGHDWAIHQEAIADGRWQAVLYVYDKMRLVRFPPGVYPTRQAIDEALKGIMDGTLQGEPIQSYG